MKVTALVAQAQALIESPLGCDRPLEKTEFNVIKQLNNATSSCYLDYLPIDATADITVKARLGNAQDYQSGKSVPLHPWIDFDADQYNLDLRNGELSLNITRSSYAYGAYSPYNTGFTHSLILTECQITYTSGFDFTDLSNSIVQGLKAQFIGVVDYMNSGIFTGQGTIARKRIDQDYEVGYHQAIAGGNNFGRGNSRGAAVGQIPDTMLIPFKKYAPRLYEF